MSLWQVDIEVVQAGTEVCNPLLEHALFVIELDQGEVVQLGDERFCLRLKHIHFGAHLILLLQHAVSHLVEGVIEHFKD